MPAGDAQRDWFPEMIEELKTSWSKTMQWEVLADFCARMTEKRRQIRHDRCIPPRRRSASSAARSHGPTSLRSRFDRPCTP